MQTESIECLIPNPWRPMRWDGRDWHPAERQDLARLIEKLNQLPADIPLPAGLILSPVWRRKACDPNPNGGCFSLVSSRRIEIATSLPSRGTYAGTRCPVHLRRQYRAVDDVLNEFLGLAPVALPEEQQPTPEQIAAKVESDRQRKLSVLIQSALRGSDRWPRYDEITKRTNHIERPVSDDEREARFREAFAMLLQDAKP